MFRRIFCDSLTRHISQGIHPESYQPTCVVIRSIVRLEATWLLVVGQLITMWQISAVVAVKVMSAIFHVVATIHSDIQFYCTLALCNVLTSCLIFCRKHLFNIHDTCSENLVHITILLNILYNALKNFNYRKVRP